MELKHVVTKAAWEAACRTGRHAPAELARDGFLHCCTPAQLEFVLGRHFTGASDLMILTFDASEVRAPVRWVVSEPGQSAFPHLYGAIPVDAVLSAEPRG
jgi:uncharacterized protein (DUF952 family)